MPYRTLESPDRVRRITRRIGFVPGLITGEGVALAFATVPLDESVTVEGWMAEQS